MNAVIKTKLTNDIEVELCMDSRELAKFLAAVAESDITSVPTIELICKTMSDKPTKAPKPRGQQTDPDFETFWAAYPSGRRAGKFEGDKAWKKATDRPDIDTMLKILEVQKASEQWAKDGGQYIPLLSTYLNKKRWTEIDLNTVEQPNPYKQENQGSMFQ